MQTPYLIQRMILTGYAGTFDDVLGMDYMGSAEFEFGALPKSLKVFTKNFDDLILNKKKNYKNYKNQMLVLIGNEEETNQYYDQYIFPLSNKELQLKERSKFDEQMSGQDMFGRPLKEFEKVDAWWDIENHIMFTFGVDNARKILKAIENTRTKKIDQNQTEWF